MIPIEHNPVLRRFSGSLNGKEYAVEYEYSKEGEVVITHTYVHPDLRGHGIAGKLLEKISFWAEEEKKRIIPLCSYAVVFYQRNKSFQHLLSDKSDLSSQGVCQISKKR
ncbi:GNAT family N-acetyltransferase [Thermospira aquatica]|uniref:N-acetyltransferase n=1 Tax=Thermospira aquatica TaxID=2828656 RepID=A0AAX3BBG5_9SPIR|nr:GNAT family N-acetyltransferase [Thermospira aquatica]URA09647.1 N-acetyltransferase [Thermospira aquatica]